MPVVSLQNGVGNVDVLLARLGGMARVVAGMVPFNVVQTREAGEPPRFHRATSGTLMIGAGVPGLREALDVRGVAVAESRDMAGVLWGKLLLNLNNALNALAGMPLAAELDPVVVGARRERDRVEQLGQVIRGAVEKPPQECRAHLEPVVGIGHAHAKLARRRLFDAASAALLVGDRPAPIRRRELDMRRA